MIYHPCHFAASAMIASTAKIYPFTTICAGALIEDKVVIGNCCFIGNGVRIGRGTRIQGNCFIPQGVSIGEDCFIGPGCTFTNCKFPPRRVTGAKITATTICDNVTIGAGCVILPGITLFDHAKFGAGCVISRSYLNVPEHVYISNGAASLVTIKSEGYINESKRNS